MTPPGTASGSVARRIGADTGGTFSDLVDDRGEIAKVAGLHVAQFTLDVGLCSRAQFAGQTFDRFGDVFVEQAPDAEDQSQCQEAGKGTA